MKIIFHCQANNGSCSLFCVFKWNSKGIGLFEFWRARKRPRLSSWSTWWKYSCVFLPSQGSIQNGPFSLEIFKRGGVHHFLYVPLTHFFCSTVHFKMQRPTSLVTVAVAWSGIGWCWIGPASKGGSPGPHTHIFLADWGHMVVCVLVAQSCPTHCDPMDYSLLSMAFTREDYWSGLSYPSPRDFPHPGIKPRFPALQVDSLPSEPWGKPHMVVLTKFWTRTWLKTHLS